jgi:hypothetical protein
VVGGSSLGCARDDGKWQRQLVMQQKCSVIRVDNHFNRKITYDFYFSGYKRETFFKSIDRFSFNLNMLVDSHNQPYHIYFFSIKFMSKLLTSKMPNIKIVALKPNKSSDILANKNKRQNSKCGYIDKTGKEVIPLKYGDAKSFSAELAPVKLYGKWGYIDKTGKEVILLKYDDAYSFSEGLARVELYDKYGFIDKTGKEVIPLKYDYAGSFSGGRIYVELNGKCFYIDKTGKQITESKCAHTNKIYCDGEYCRACGKYFGR